MSLKFHHISDSSTLLKWRGEWSEFYKDLNISIGFDFDTAFELFNLYININTKNSNYRYEPFVLIVKDDNAIIAILPLLIISRKKLNFIWQRQISFLGQNISQTTLDIVSNELDLNNLEHIFKFLRRKLKYHYLNLQFLTKNSALIKNDKKSSFLYSGQVNIILNKKYDEIRQKSYTKKLKQNLNKYSRKLAEIDQDISYGLSFDKEFIKSIRSEIAEISDTKQAIKNYQNIHKNVEFGDYFFNSILNKNEPFISYYKVDNTLVSYMLCYKTDSVIYGIEGGYNRNVILNKNISFGALAIDLIVKHFADKADYFNLGFGLNPYKLQFSKNTDKIYMYVRRGKGILSYIFYHHFLRKVKKSHQIVESKLFEIDNIVNNKKY